MFTSDSRTENFLTSMGVKFEYRNAVMLPADFKKGWDTENIGRPVAVREDAVLEYASLMESGSAAPAPIVYQTDKGFRVLDGVQRLSAAELRQETRVSVYVVRTDSEDVLAAIRVLANARMQGRAEPAEWTRRRAVEVLVVDRGLSAGEVARMGGWRPGDVRKIADGIETQRRVTAVGGPELTDSMLSELKPYLTGSLLESASAPIVNFMSTLKQSKIAVADAVPYIEQFFQPLSKGSNPYKTYTERLAEIKEDPELQSRLTGRAATELPKDVVLLRALKSADTIVDHITANTEIQVRNIDEFFRILSGLSKKLKAISQRKTSRTPKRVTQQ